jgi:hypothetical protein
MELNFGWTKYNRPMSRERAIELLDRTSRDPNWAPPGGTSNARYREERDQFETAFTALLRERITERANMWITEYGMGQIYVGWKDDPRGGYFVSRGLEHQIELTPEDMRSFSYLVYTHEDERGETDRRDESLGELWVEPPYARDVKLHVASLLMWLDAHRQTLTMLKAT